MASASQGIETSNTLLCYLVRFSMPQSVLIAIMDRTALPQGFSDSLGTVTSGDVVTYTGDERTSNDSNICVVYVLHLFGFFTHGFSQYLDELFHSNVLVAVIVYSVGPVTHMSSTVAKIHCSISLMI